MKIAWSFLGFLAMTSLLCAQEPMATPAPGVIEAKGQLKAFREVRLASRAKGVIRDIKEEGSEVKEGETVAVLEDALERLTVDQQKAVFDLRDFEGKIGESLTKQDAISRQEAMEKKINLQIASIQLAQSMELLDRRRVMAPFHCFVTERLRATGESVDEFVPILTLMDLSQLYFETYLPADQVRNIQDGETAEVRIDTFPEKIFTGKVALKSPVVNPASLEFKVKIVIDNSDHLLSAGLSGTCRILPPGKKPQG